MDRFGEDDKEEMFRSRYSYMCDVINGLYRTRLSFPSASQEKLYDDALRHVVFRSWSCCMNRTRCSQKQKSRTRKEVLKEILNLLLWLQRERLYDPPADDEIGYYFLIKRYIRSIIAFFEPCSSAGIVKPFDGEKIFDCYRAIDGLHHMEELSELNQHLADLAAFVSEADFRKGSSVTPLMGINDKKIHVHPLIEGSKERSNAFYLNKFELAKFDFCSTEFAHCPPSLEEKRLYVQALNDLRSASSIAVEEPNIFSDLLCCLFIERTEREIKDMERHCRRIKDLILDKLSLTERYELIHEQFKSEVQSYNQNYDPEEIDDPEMDLTDFKRKVAHQCEVSDKELTNYIRCVDQYQRIAVNVVVFINSCLSDDDDVRTHADQEAGWQFLHFLTILKQGRFCFGTVLQEHSVARISKKRARGEFKEDAKLMQKCGTKNDKNGNLKILRGIVEDLRCIGVSDIETDDDEEQLLYKIWQNVASCIQFFLSAVAYEQRHYISKCGGLPDGRIPGLRTTRRKRYTTIKQVENRLSELVFEVSDLSYILAALRDGLLENTGKDGLHARAM